MLKTPEHVHNHFDETKNRTSIIEQEDTYFFGQDGNCSRSMLEHRIAGIGDAFFREGQKITGAQPHIDIATGVCNALDTEIYISGMVRKVVPSVLQIPASGELQIGIVLEASIVTYLEDPTLRFSDQSFDSHQQPLSPQLQEVPRWGLSTEDLTSDDKIDYRFFPLYHVKDRVLIDSKAPAALSGFNGELARYDREANGHYVVSGFKVSLLNAATSEIALSIEEGTANVWGVKIDRQNSQRFAFEQDADTEVINSEPHIFADNGSGTLEIETNRAPIGQVFDISVLVEKTTSLQRGLAGERDPLPDVQVALVTSISQGATEYILGVDFVLAGDEIDWSIGASFPADGELYDVTYQHKISIEADSVSSNSITVSGAVSNSQVDIDYSWKLPRVDVLTLDKTGTVARVLGQPRRDFPKPPQVPGTLLVLAEIHHNWMDAATILDTAIRAVPMQDLEAHRDLIVQLFGEVGRMQLITDATNASGYAKSAIYADNFDDESQRDRGTPQTLSIVNGMLILPIDVTVEASLLQSPFGWHNEIELQTFMAQLSHTGDMKINPYQVTRPLPAKVTLSPAFDQWTTVNTIWTSDITRRLADWTRTIGSGNSSSVSSTTQTSRGTELVRSSTRDDDVLRQRDVTFTLGGFDPNEELQSLIFDGVTVPLPDPIFAANTEGVLEGSFQIPEGLTTGSKLVEFRGDQGSGGAASYVGRGTIEINEMRRITTVRRVTTIQRSQVDDDDDDNDTGWDPLGYLWTPSTSFPLGAVRVKIEEIGDPNNPVILQVRRTAASQPVGDALVEVEVDLKNSSKGDILEFVLPNPLWCEAFETLANVFITNDGLHTLAIAKLGKQDQNGQWVTEQPNTNMVAISSSNNSAFNFHHDLDLWTQILRANFTENEQEIQLGTINVENTTDILVLAGVDRPTGDTEVEFVLERENGSKIRTLPNETTTLTQALNETLIVSAILKGTPTASPILYPNIQVITGSVQSSGNYVSKNFECGVNKTIEITTMQRTPGASAFVIKAKDSDGNFANTTLHSTTDEGNGWYKRVYRLGGVTADTTAIEITASGSALNRPAMQYYHAAVLAI